MCPKSILTPVEQKKKLLMSDSQPLVDHALEKAAEAEAAGTSVTDLPADERNDVLMARLDQKVDGLTDLVNQWGQHTEKRIDTGEETARAQSIDIEVLKTQTAANTSWINVAHNIILYILIPIIAWAIGKFVDFKLIP